MSYAIAYNTIEFCLNLNLNLNLNLDLHIPILISLNSSLFVFPIALIPIANVPSK